MKKQDLPEWVPKDLVIPKGWEFALSGGQNNGTDFIYLQKKKDSYPKSFDELGKNAMFSQYGWYSLHKLIKLRNEYRKIANGGKEWIPNWKNLEDKYIIVPSMDIWEVDSSMIDPHIFSFPTYESAQKFLDNFCDLLNEVTPLFTE